MDAKQIGLRLKEMREEKGFTQQQLAAAAGISQRAVSHVEQGRNEPSFSSVVALASALGVDCRAFLQPPADASPVSRGRPSKASTADTPSDGVDAADAKPELKKGKRKK